MPNILSKKDMVKNVIDLAKEKKASVLKNMN
jgi:hypothetical protein